MFCLISSTHPPTIAIPIDALPRDLSQWAQSLRNLVKIWVIEKYVSTSDPSKVLYSLFGVKYFLRLTTTIFPDSIHVDRRVGAVREVRTPGSQPFQELIAAIPDLVGRKLKLDYGPRGAERHTFEGVLRPDGIEVDGRTYSPSYAAVYCIQKAGSTRKTANGWIIGALKKVITWPIFMSVVGLIRRNQRSQKFVTQDQRTIAAHTANHPAARSLNNFWCQCCNAVFGRKRSGKATLKGGPALQCALERFIAAPARKGVEIGRTHVRRRSGVIEGSKAA
jgi:hypothetical protein